MNVIDIFIWLLFIAIADISAERFICWTLYLVDIKPLTNVNLKCYPTKISKWYMDMSHGSYCFESHVKPAKDQQSIFRMPPLFSNWSFYDFLSDQHDLPFV